MPKVRSPIWVGKETTPPPRPLWAATGVGQDVVLSQRVGHVLGKERADAIRTGCCAVLSVHSRFLYWIYQGINDL